MFGSRTAEHDASNSGRLMAIGVQLIYFFAKGHSMETARVPVVDSSGVLPAGFRLAERYRILNLIRAGGFGITYLVEHEVLNKQYAIKENFPRQFSSRQGTTVVPNTANIDIYRWGLERFIAEAQKLARFKHSSIVDVNDVFEANGTAYMVMTFEDGSSLADWLGALGRRPAQSELDNICAPLLGALEYIHSKGFLHRDIAPDNIIIRREGPPCLIDFGAARQAMAEVSNSLTAIVRPGYSPVEQYVVDASGQGAWTDIYALAATLYRAVTGAKPPEAPGRIGQDSCVQALAAAGSGYRSTFLRAIDEGLRVQARMRPQSIADWRMMLLANAGAATIATPAVSRSTASPQATKNSTQAPLSVHGDTASQQTQRSRTPLIALWLTVASVGGLAALIVPQWGGPKPQEGLAPMELRGASEAERHRQVRNSLAVSVWSRLRDTTNEAAIEQFLESYGDTPAAVEARARLAQLQTERTRLRNAAADTEWERIRATEDETLLERFLLSHGDAPAASTARRRLIEIRQRRARIAAAAAEWERLMSTADEAAIARFIEANPDTPAATEARSWLMAVRQRKQSAASDQIPHSPAASLGPNPGEAEHRDTIVQFVRHITTLWNNGITEPEIFAERLVYYGKAVERARAITETQNYFKRWVLRTFAVDERTIAIQGLGPDLFDVSYNYQFSGTRADGILTKGSGRYFLKLQRVGSRFEIVDVRDDFRSTR